MARYDNVNVYSEDYEDRERSLGPIGGLALLGLAGIGILAVRRFIMAGRPERLSRSARDEFVDKCTARWLFEKTGVRLYERLLEKCPEEFREQFEDFRDEEKEHEEMLEDIIRKYGADPHAMTESARITEIESRGIIQVVEQEGFEAGLDALLTAELVDNANWDLLIKLARKVGDFEAVAKFGKAMVKEAHHLYFIRKQVIKEAVDVIEGHAPLMSVH